VIEPPNAILDRGARGEHDDRHPDTVGAQPAADLEAVDPRQAHVQDHHVVLGCAHHPGGIAAVDGDVGEDALGTQRAADGRRHGHVVLDEKHPHRAIVAALDETNLRTVSHHERRPIQRAQRLGHLPAGVRGSGPEQAPRRELRPAAPARRVEVWSTCSRLRPGFSRPTSWRKPSLLVVACASGSTACVSSMWMTAGSPSTMTSSRPRS